MSIVVKQLSKQYGQQWAVNNISFEVSGSEVLGLLGPNGAGKTTTMKILAGYEAQTSGKAIVGGFDTRKDPLSVKKITGYLPEHNPLYPEMYVREFLRFACALHRLPKRKQKIDRVVSLTGLDREVHKRIGQLSKGYRQRVGIAQVMLHDPAVLILDEPISGLDPNQLIEIRALIKNLGKAKTVIFSSHIMQEVQAVCDRVVILNNGQMVLNTPISELDHIVHERQRIRVTFDRKVNPNTLLKESHITAVKHTGDNTYEVRSEPGVDIRPVIYDFSVQKVVKILEMYEISAGVENVFQILTKSRER